MAIGSFKTPISSGGATNSDKYYTRSPYNAAPPPNYIRPADWLDISDVTNNEINLLTSDLEPISFIVTLSSGTYTIDWGDGSADTARASGVTYSHTYVEGTGTPCSLGYTTFKIKITGADNITNFQIGFIGTSRNDSPILEANFGITTLNRQAGASYMFFNSTAQTTVCPNLRSVKLASWGTSTIADYIFSSCSALENIELPPTWGSLTSAMGLFNGCLLLKNVVLPETWGGIKYLNSLFGACYSLSNQIIPNTWGQVTNVNGLFYYCTSLTSMTLPTSWGSVTTINELFNQCTALTSLTFPTSWGSVSSIMSFLQNCKALTEVNLPSNWGLINTASYAFSGCTALVKLDLPPSWGLITGLNSFFESCSNLNIVKWPTSWGKVTTVASMFLNCYSLTSATLPSSWELVTSSNSMFQYCPSLKSVNLPTSWNNNLGVLNMFHGCTTLEKLVLPSTWGSITNVSYMFSGCQALYSLNLPISWGNITNVTYMFYGCVSLAKIDLPTTWQNVVATTQMFFGCQALTLVTLPLSWGNITSVANMFYSCTNLVSINLPSSWANMQAAAGLFYGCTALQSITFPPTYGTSLNDVSSIITGCSSLREIINYEFVGSTTTQCNLSQLFSGNAKHTPRNFITNSLLSKISGDGSAYTSTSFIHNLFSLRLLNQNSLFTGASPQINVSATNLNRPALETLFNDLPIGLSGKVINISVANGARDLITKTSCGTTAGSYVITQANTSNLQINQEVYGAGISLGRAVTFTDSGDTVNLTANGFFNGQQVSFSAITSTTGITINRPYFIVNKTTDTFQVSTTLNGTPLTLTTNGSGTLIIIPKIVSITPNVNITISAPCFATATITAMFGRTKRSIALLKGWTVTG